MDNNPVVSICTITYNHAPYIHQCLDGFLMQKTDFPIEVLIHDDASTDGTADIIREYEKKYPDIIKPIYQTENQYSKGIKISRTYNYPRAKGKYIAICEGDDYWTDPHKLQKQVDFLEKNPEYGMCYTKVKTYIQQQRKYLKRAFGGNAVTFGELINNNTIPTPTVCLRKDLLLRYYKEVKPESKNWLMGDYPIWLWFSYNSKICFLNEITGVYRVLKESSSHSENMEKEISFYVSYIEIKRYFINIYNHKGIDLYSKELLGKAFIALSHYQYILYKMYISKVKIKTLKILLKKVISKSYLLFNLYYFYIRMTEKY